MRQETFLYLQSNQLEYTSVTIDKQSKTVTFAAELQDETILLDALLMPSDFKSTFDFDVMGKIVSELLQGFNSSLILIGGQQAAISDIIQGGVNGFNEEFGLFQSVVSGLLGEGRKLSLTVFEVYADVVRDMIDPTKNISISDSIIGVEVVGLSNLSIGSVTDIAQAMKKVQDHQFQSTNDDNKCWVIYSIGLIQTKLENTILESQFKIISTCALEYAAVDQTKLVLAHGQLLAESLSSFFECVGDPSLLYTSSSILPNLLEAEIGGNTVTRWIGVLNESNIESEQANYLFNLFKNAQSIINHPVLNAKEYNLNRQRDLKRYKARTGIKSEELEVIRSQQREKDLISRINMLIQSSAQIQTQVQSSKKQAVESRKRYLDVQVEKSQLSDELDRANEIIQEFKDKDRIAQRTTSEKSGLQKKITALNERMESKVQELNFYINTLLNANSYYEEQLADCRHQIDLLVKHNSFLQSRFGASSKDSTNEAQKMGHNIPHSIITDSERDKELTMLYEKHHSLREEYRKRTMDAMEKLSIQSNSDQVRDLVSHFQKEVLQSYVDHELDLVGQIEALRKGHALVGSSLLSSHTHELLKRELREFIMTTQMSLEREKYALLAKCSALEEEYK